MQQFGFKGFHFFGFAIVDVVVAHEVEDAVDGEVGVVLFGGFALFGGFFEDDLRADDEVAVQAV